MSLSIDSMRRIDRWLGVPLCAVSSLVVKLADWVSKKSSPRAPPKRVLFIELSEMGSAIIADPAMRAAQAQGAETYFLIFKSNQVSLTLLNTIPAQNIFTIDASGICSLARDTLRFLYVARRKRMDTVIDLELFSRFSALLTGLSGAQRRVGYHVFHGEGLWRGTMLTHKVHYNPQQHMAKNFLALVYAAFALAPELPYSKVRITDAETQIAQAHIDPALRRVVLERIQMRAQQAGVAWRQAQNPLFLVNPNASDLLVQRRWAPERFSQLIAALARKWPDSLILITGAQQEYDYVE
jgi:ADP-heptose:LPS heptosyltransferase